MKRNGMPKNPRHFSISRCWGEGDFAHICFESAGCRFRKQGYCTMCNYGEGRCITPQEAVAALNQLQHTHPGKIRRLLLGTCGSIFDEGELPNSVFSAVLNWIAPSDINDILFETHYTTVTQSVLDQIADALTGRTVSIEMGMESANIDVLTSSLHKYMDLEQLRHTMTLIHQNHFRVILNVLLGVPDLTMRQQLEDTKASLLWAEQNGADEFVLFPVNIKPDTALWEQYQAGNYAPVSHWLLIELLLSLPDSILSRLSLSWYGDRQEAGEDTDIIPPVACATCKPALMSFYQRFMENPSAEYRKELIEALINGISCECREALLREIAE